MPYDHKSVEQKWQRRWIEAKVFATPDPSESRPKYYILDMFPYPSAAGLHVGHPEGYTATDIIARMKRMQGFAVLHPMGWDAFGLPAENYAIQTGIHPHETTQKSIATFKRQIEALGFSYDWDREIDTTDPNYYKWTQWLFLQIFKKGLAYEAVVPINFCPSCKTGLANEEVHQGACERCATPVEKRDLRQWMLKITAYAQDLLDDLKDLDWPESTLLMQKNWIGRSEGAFVRFSVENEPDLKLEIFTTRPDTLFGATFMALAPEHPYLERLTKESQKKAVNDYARQAKQKSDMERATLERKKTGVFTGAYAVNPVNGEKLPIWVADYVLMNYGSGAIMSVPAHDSRDLEFAKTFNLPVKQVVCPPTAIKWDQGRAYEGEGTTVNSGPFDGLSTQNFKKEITAWLKERQLGHGGVTFKLRDWVFSRQRYWGEPLPVIHCKGKCQKPVPVPEKDLPVLLPKIEKFQPTGTGDSPLTALKEWIAVKCPQCAGPGERETNTMPQWAGSCWYYLRFLDPKNEHAPWGKDQEHCWMPIDLYVGGSEHAVLHLLYARFWHKVFYDIGLTGAREPFKRLRHQGMILSYSYQDQKGAYHAYDEVNHDGEGPRLKNTGEPLKEQIEKMSKSKKNVVNPDVVIERYGADAMRLYEMFMGDFELPKPWDMRTVEGVARFLSKIWRLIESYNDKQTNDPHLRLRHKTIKFVTQRIENFKFNTAITALMEYVNALSAQGANRQDLETLLKLISPFAPHLAEEGWERLDAAPFIAATAWPTYDSQLALDDKMAIPIQINGKIRDTLEILPDQQQDREFVETQARLSPKIAKYLENAKVKKVIYVPGKIISFVVA